MSDAGLGIIVAGAIGSYGGGPQKSTRRRIGNIIAQITESERHHDELEITDHPVEQGASITDHAFKRPAEVTLRVSWSNSVSKPATLAGNLIDAAANTLAGVVQTGVTGAALNAIGGSALGNLAVAQLAKLTSEGISTITQVNSGVGVGTSLIEDIYQQLIKLQESRTVIDIYTGKRVYKSMLIKSITTESDIKNENSLPVILVCRQVIIVKTSTVTVTADPSDQAAPQSTEPPADLGTKQTLPADPLAKPSLLKALENIWKP